MKTAIDNDGNQVQVSDDTTVKTINGIHYLLTSTDIAAINQKELDWQNAASERVLQDCYNKRTMDINNGGYGTFGEQFDMIFHQGMDVWLTHIQNVKNANPKPKG